MNKKILYSIFLATILFLFLTPQGLLLSQFGAPPAGGYGGGGGGGGGGQTLQSIVDALAKNLVPLAASLATIAFIVSGIMFLSATGNPSMMSVAKGSLIAGVIGIVIVLLAAGASGFVKALFGL